MSASVTPRIIAIDVAWWKEPTKTSGMPTSPPGSVGRSMRRLHHLPADHVPIAQEFDVPITAVAIVFTLTLWLRLVAPRPPAGWPIAWGARPADDSILWYSLCNFIAGFSPSFYFLLFWRACGIGRGPNGRPEPPCHGILARRSRVS